VNIQPSTITKDSSQWRDYRRRLGAGGPRRLCPPDYDFFLILRNLQGPVPAEVYFLDFSLSAPGHTFEELVPKAGKGQAVPVDVPPDAHLFFSPIFSERMQPQICGPPPNLIEFIHASA